MQKPTVDGILKITDKCVEFYSGLDTALKEDERFYELEFKEDLHIPDEFKDDAVVLPTTRDKVDAIVDHTDISHPRVYVNKKGTGETSKEQAEMLRKFGLGVLHRVNVESSISPQRASAKHYWKHGLSWVKTTWDADNWIDKPLQGEDELDDTYAERIEEWRAKTHEAFPINIQEIHPLSILPDPYTFGKLYVIERHKKLVFDAKKLPFKWDNPNDKSDDTEVEYLEYWDKDYRCVLIDREPVWKVGGGVIKHKYGFIPYTLIESGLGDITMFNKPEKRFVGLIRHMKDLLISESVVFSMCNILTKRETMKGGWISGADADSVGAVKQEYGKYWPVGQKDVEFHDWESKLPAREAFAHLALIRELIDIHSAPRTLFGMGETGVRSGADRRLVLAEAQSKLNYSKDSFSNGWANVLNKCARLVKDVIPGDFEVWYASSPYDEFHMPIKKSLFKPPFNFYIEFSPISEEDEYRRHEDLMRMFQSGLYTKFHARTRLPDVDPLAMEKQEMKELIRNSPAYLEVISGHFAQLTQQALTEAGIPTSGAMAGQPMGAQQTGTAGRSLVPGIPERAQPGSQQEMLNQIQGQYGRPKFKPNQGAGGGGNRSFGV